ncbi:MAG TPA: flagellar hook assembly protein FlgD [Limnobacter sp.]|uniref:flagellar hook assembly protein FlgD n=1 Tax=Limnobacter sp. TaxID=2003368 RepID=UPI002EDA69B5
MAIDATSSVGTASKASATAKKNENSPEAIQERFMSLLVAQLKNQDPMAPMDNAQVTSQMAQLNTVTGINKLNDSMSAMAASVASNQTAQAVTMLGRAVLTEGNDIAMKDGVGTGSLEMKQSADSVQVNILDSNAKVIRTMDMGPQAKGIHQFDWDGKDANGNLVPAGNYKFEVQATAAGQKADVTTLSLAVVQGVRNAGSEGSKLLTNLGTELSFSDIKQIF